MTSLTILKADHRKVEELFKKILKPNTSFENQRKLFDELKESLTLHAKTEEKFLYPQMEKTKEAHDLTLEAYEEHNMVKILLKEIPLVSEKDVWEAKVVVLQEQVKHHVEEEEEELFPIVEKKFSPKELTLLGEEIQAWREKGLKETASDIVSNVVEKLGLSKE